MIFLTGTKCKIHFIYVRFNCKWKKWTKKWQKSLIISFFPNPSLSIWMRASLWAGHQHVVACWYCRTCDNNAVNQVADSAIRFWKQITPFLQNFSGTGDWCTSQTVIDWLKPPGKKFKPVIAQEIKILRWIWFSSKHNFKHSWIICL